MKYEAVIETDDFEDFEFFEDGNGKYIHGIDAGAVNNEWIALYFKECKQESILDEIRAKIKNYCGLTKTQCRYCSYCNSLMGVREILEIIDKYKASPTGEEVEE